MGKRLEGMSALVTGGSQGIGKAVALALGREGARIGIVHLPADAALAAAAAGEIEGLGSRALALPADVTDYAAMAGAAGRLAGAFGGIDIVVTCAGILRRVSFLEETVENWNAVIAVNLTGTFNAIHAALPFLRASRRGKVVTIASQQHVTGRGKPSYVASKSGVVGLTKALAHELGPLGINVNCVAPGATDTPMLRSAPNIDGAYIASIPLRRIGTPEDVAETVLFLASPAADYFAGQVLGPNGGSAM